MSDDTEDLAWRNLVADWHLAHGMPGCGCDDDTADGDFCQPSRDWADAQYADRPVPALDGPPDKWNHDIWVAAWGHNVPLVAGDRDFRLPTPPKGMTWLATRMLIGGVKAVELALIRLTETNLVTLARSRVVPEPTTVVAKARRMLQQTLD